MLLSYIPSYYYAYRYIRENQPYHNVSYHNDLLPPRHHLSIKTVFFRCGDSHVKYKTVKRPALFLLWFGYIIFYLWINGTLPHSTSVLLWMASVFAPAANLLQNRFVHSKNGYGTVATCHLLSLTLNEDINHKWLMSVWHNKSDYSKTRLNYGTAFAL